MMKEKFMDKKYVRGKRIMKNFVRIAGQGISHTSVICEQTSNKTVWSRYHSLKLTRV